MHFEEKVTIGYIIITFIGVATIVMITADTGASNDTTKCVVHGRSCEVSMFHPEPGITCLRWHAGSGSDMECWRDVWKE